MTHHQEHTNWANFAKKVRLARSSFDAESLDDSVDREEWIKFLILLDENIDGESSEWEYLLAPAFRRLKKSMCCSLNSSESELWLEIWKDFSSLTNATSLTMLDAMSRFDETAWCRFIGEYEPLFEKVIRRWKKKYPFLVTAEIISDLNIALLETIETFERENWGHFRAWLSKFLWHILQTAVRRQRYHTVSNLVDHLSDPSENPVKQFEIELLNYDLTICENLIRERNANSNSWSWYEAAKNTDLPWEEIGRNTGQSEEAVKKSAHRTLAKIKRELSIRGHHVNGIKFRRRATRKKTN